jgi:hypothetical protein
MQPTNGNSTRITRKRFVFSIVASVLISLVLALASAAVANANTPDPRNCIADTELLGSPGGGFLYSVTLRDAANQAIAGGTVVLDFTSAPGIVICSDQDTDLDGRLLGTTNGAGVCTFYVKAGGNSTGYVIVGTAIEAITQAAPRTPDFDGDLDVDAVDRAALAALLGTSGPAGDFDLNGIVNGADQTIFESRFGHTCTLTPVQAETWGAVKAMYR